MRRHKLVLSGEWHDQEKLDYMRSTVAAKLKEQDPETKHPVFWFAFLVCSLPVNHFTKRNLALISCVPPTFSKEDNPAILPSTALRNLENNGGGGGGGVSSSSSTGGVTSKKKKSINVDNSSSGDSSTSSFSHTVQLVSQNQEEKELAHLAVQVSAIIREAIYALQQIDADMYRVELQKLQRDLANTVLHQVRIMQLRTEQFNDQRVREATADVVARQIVDLAKRKVSVNSTPLSAFGSPNMDPESTQIFRFDSSISNITASHSKSVEAQDKPSSSSSVVAPQSYIRTVRNELVHTKLFYSDAESFDTTMHEHYGYVTMAPSSWTSKEPTMEVLAKLRSFLDLPTVDDQGLFMIQKWIKLIANKLGVDLQECGLDNGPPTKRSRPHNQLDEEVDWVDDSYNHFA
jgi:hypothetical protein